MSLYCKVSKLNNGRRDFSLRKMNNITFKQYRVIDITILSIILAISEGITTLATTRWFTAVPFVISTTLLFLCIGMMRWGAYSAVMAVIGGAVFVFASGADAKRCVIYIIGNLFALIALVFIRLIGNNRLRKSIPLLLTYAAITYLAVSLGRWLVSLVFEPSLKSLLAYVGVDVVTLLFTAVLLTLMRNVDGMLEDQREYILRQAKERGAEAASDGDDLEAIIDDPDYLDGILEDTDSED